MDPVLTVIDEALARSGLTDAAASKLAVGNYSLLKNMRAARGEDKRYSFQALQELARVLGLECYFGPKREFSGFAEGSETADLGKVEAIRGGYLPIPWHDQARGTGSSPVAFMQSWIATQGLIPDFLRAVVPTIVNLSFTAAKNTVAVLDTKAPHKGGAGIWCYREGPSVGICRAAFRPDMTILLPGDDDGEVRIVEKSASSSFAILGKVVWLGLLVRP